MNAGIRHCISFNIRQTQEKVLQKLFLDFSN